MLGLTWYDSKLFCISRDAKVSGVKILKKRAKGSRDLTKRVTRAVFIRQLRRLADSLECGDRFTISVGKERITLPSEIECSIEHEREGVAEELELQVRWHRKS